MKTFSAAEARTRFGEIAEIVQTEPLRVTRKGRPVFVVLSEKQYAQMAEQPKAQPEPRSGAELLKRIRARFAEFEDRTELELPERQPLSEPKTRFGKSE